MTAGGKRLICPKVILRLRLSLYLYVFLSISIYISISVFLSLSSLSHLSLSETKREKKLKNNSLYVATIHLYTNRIIPVHFRNCGTLRVNNAI